jgi:predicted CXXCH cytochrome family protein
MVTTESGGVIIGFSDVSGTEMITLKVNGEEHEIELWDGTFELDMDWIEGENVIKAGKLTVTFFADEYTARPKEPFIHQEIYYNCGNCHILGPELDLTLRADLEDLCQGCHEQRHKSLRHGDVACSDCHLPHISWNPNLLVGTGNDFCLGCHEALSATGEQGAHGTVWEKIECSQCHLSGHTPGAVREGLCAGCHEGQAVTVVAHVDVVRQACPTCHSMHGEAGSGQWKSPQESCMGCHQPAAAEVHLGVDEKCGDCHGIHKDKSLPKQDVALCRDCHESFSSKKRLHAPEASGNCCACHPIHDLENRSASVFSCVQCHSMEKLQSGHTGSINGFDTCVLCHELHSSDEPGFLPLYEHAPFARRDCNGCHNWPGFTAGRKLEGPWSEFCLSCHPEKRADLNHSPAKAGDCKACHTPHGSDQPKLLIWEGDQLCGSCHEKIVANWDDEGRHGGENGCRFCHDPHGTAESKALLFNSQSGCLACHRDPTLGFGDVVRAFVHGPMNMDNCQICHDWHVNGDDAYLHGPASEQCMQCHQVNLVSSDELLAPKVHGALLTGRCGACHNVHSAENAKFLRLDGNDLCMKCHKGMHHRHSFSTQIRVSGIEIPEDWPINSGQLGCLGCHEAHESPIGNLLVKSRGCSVRPVTSRTKKGRQRGGLFRSVHLVY